MMSLIKNITFTILSLIIIIGICLWWLNGVMFDITLDVGFALTPEGRSVLMDMLIPDPAPTPSGYGGLEGGIGMPEIDDGRMTLEVVSQ